MRIAIKRGLWIVAAIVILTPLSAYLYENYRYHVTPYIVHSLYSPQMNEQRKVFVRLPQDYHLKPDKTYPVVYKLDGNFRLQHWDNSLAVMSDAGLIDEAIVVAIPNMWLKGTRNRDLYPPYARVKPFSQDPTLARGDRFLAFIGEQLIEFIDNNYRTSAERILAGHSAGGNFVIYTLLNRPELFNGYFAFSPALWLEDGVLVDKTAKMLQSGQAPKAFLYLSMGKEEHPAMFPPWHKMHRLLEQYTTSPLVWQLDEIDFADHSLNPVRSLPCALFQYSKYKYQQLTQSNQLASSDIIEKCLRESPSLESKYLTE